MRNLFLALAAVAVVPMANAQAFLDTFDSNDPAWITDRYEPAAWNPGTAFMGGTVLELTVDDTTGSANRPGGQSGEFYNTQGRKHAATLTSPWRVFGDVFVSADMVNGTDRRRTDLWARTGDGVEANATYPIFGMRQFDPADAYNGSSMSTDWRVWDPENGGWNLVGGTVTEGWHTLEIVGDGTSFEYFLDGNSVYTDNTVNVAFPGLTEVFVQAFNFSPVNGLANDSYSVYWDNVGAQAVPEPATMVALGLGVAAMVRRRRKA